MICLNLLDSIEFDLIAPLNGASLLIRVNFQFILLCLCFLISLYFYLILSGVAGIVHIKRFHDWCLIQLLQDLFWVLHLVSLPFCQILWSDNIIVQIIKDLFDEWAEMLLHLFELGREFFVSIKIAFCCSNHNYLIW